MSRDESKPPPGWTEVVGFHGHATGSFVRHWLPGRSSAEAWRIYDAEHGYAPTPAEPAALPEGFTLHDGAVWIVYGDDCRPPEQRMAWIDRSRDPAGRVFVNEVFTYGVEVACMRALLSLPAPDESARVRELLREIQFFIADQGMQPGGAALLKRIDAALARKAGADG